VHFHTMGRPGVLPLIGQTLNSDTLLPYTVTNVQLTRATVVLRAGACELHVHSSKKITVIISATTITT